MPYVQLSSAYLVAKLYIKTSVWRAFKHYLNPTLNFKSLEFESFKILQWYSQSLSNTLVQYLTIGSLMI